MNQLPSSNYESDRSGAFEIWKNDLRTGESFQVTHLRHLGSGSPVWSPDSKEIAFDSRFEGTADIYKVSSAGGTPTRLTHGGGTGTLPIWSLDGRWIYFSSNRSGTPQIWRVSANGRLAEQITQHAVWIPGYLRTEATFTTPRDSKNDPSGVFRHREAWRPKSLTIPFCVGLLSAARGFSTWSRCSLKASNSDIWTPQLG